MGTLPRCHPGVRAGQLCAATKRVLAAETVVLAVLGKPLPTSNGNQGPVIGAGLIPAGNGVVVGPP